MKQSDINAEWHKELDSNVGKIGLLVQPRQVTPGLRKPYEWVLKTHEAYALSRSLIKLAKIERSACQCTLVETKSLRYGIHLSLFFLSCPPGWFKEYTGHTALQWTSLGEALKFTLTPLAGAKVYIEEWSDKKKFQIRFDAYIAAEEMINHA